MQLVIITVGSIPLFIFYQWGKEFLVSGSKFYLFSFFHYALFSFYYILFSATKEINASHEFVISLFFFFFCCEKRSAASRPVFLCSELELIFVYFTVT